MPAGSRRTPLEELFDLAVKARLQSLLIERFGELLLLDEVEGTAGSVVGVRHRNYAKDACHAVVKDLSAAAQAWVRWERDLRRAGEDEGAPGRAASSAPASSRPKR